MGSKSLRHQVFASKTTISALCSAIFVNHDGVAKKLMKLSKQVQIEFSSCCLTTVGKIYQLTLVTSTVEKLLFYAI